MKLDGHRLGLVCDSSPDFSGGRVGLGLSPFFPPTILDSSQNISLAGCEYINLVLEMVMENNVTRQ